jgi:hypothetical protein
MSKAQLTKLITERQEFMRLRRKNVMRARLDTQRGKCAVNMQALVKGFLARCRLAGPIKGCTAPDVLDDAVERPTG